MHDIQTYKIMFPIKCNVKNIKFCIHVYKKAFRCTTAYGRRYFLKCMYTAQNIRKLTYVFQMYKSMFIIHDYTNGFDMGYDGNVWKCIFNLCFIVYFYYT